MTIPTTAAAVAIGVLAIAATPAVAATPAPAAAAPAKKPAIALPDLVSWKLDNGLEVFYLGVHGTPVVTVQVFYHVGSKDEPADRRGTAHMFEHLLYQGSEHVRADEHTRMIEALGGDSGAFTSWDMTGFHDTLPSGYMDFAVQLEAERMRRVLFRKDTIDRQRDIVKQEKRMRLESSPIAGAIEQFTAYAFGERPYAWSPSGDVADLEKVGADDLQAFYDRYYQPGNAALVIVGDVSEDEARASAQKWFGKIPAAPAPPRVPAPDAAAPKEPRRATSDQPSQLGIVIGGYPIPAASHKDIVPLKVVASLLTEGESSRLKQRIVAKDKIGVAAGGQLLVLEQPGFFFLFAAHAKPDDGPKVEKAMLDEVAKMGTTGPSAKDLDKAKNQLAARFVFALDSVDGIAQQIGLSWVNSGDPRAWLKEYDAIAAVTVADVTRVVKTYLKPTSLTLMTFAPGGGGK